eukprot:CAMPEP_0197174588 /NCGR_PEP_ID=MMETSP1423-20130617/1040_1 /TAXON_ID=476441 /ORGANISM="Pseudo-nitzschia heimii, Strain UNC1101" /LENGTH=700 /DNA_ID=CAMNT_0042623531 /DNA_START=93 /DNA_END=2195 /DNA_ORIENTATION=-
MADHDGGSTERNHIEISPTFSCSYSDNVDNVDNGEKCDSPFFDHSNISGNNKNMRFFDIDVEEDQVGHDQLPSVEEVKANAHFDDAMRRPTRNKRRNRKLPLLLCAIVIAGAFVMGSLASSKRKQRQTAIASVTKTVRISHPDVFLDSNSPQSRALDWMIYDDEMKLSLPAKKTDPFVQRYVIAVFVFALTTENTKITTALSKNSTRDSFDLLSDAHECDWNSEWDRVDLFDKLGDIVNQRVTLGIICGFSNEILNDDAISTGSVTGILLPRSGLEGELPPELEVLRYLTRLDLNNNQIRGKIPTLPYLNDLSLAYNQLSGNLPDHFSQMTRLRSLSLSGNAFQGYVPIRFSALTDLNILALNENQLTGGLEEIYPLTNLEELYLSKNSFEDHLSHGSFKELSGLRVIDLKNNRISGPLPNALWKLTNLEVIDFHKNAIDGHINDVIVEGHPLKYLDVSNNFLGGGLPSTVSHLTSLTHLDVSYNRLDTRLSQTHLAGMTKMKSLLLTEEDGLGPQPITEWLRGMTDLEQVSFRLTARTGTLPTWFGELTRLQLLDLDWNHISGTIPTELGRLTNLRYLMLNRNLMTGTVPTVVSYLPHLKILMLDTNEFDRVVLTGDEDVCELEGFDGRIDHLVADCGRMDKGVPVEREVVCPCCTDCCWDSLQRCNMKDSIIELEEEYRSSYDRYEYDFDGAYYVPAV